MYSKGFRKKAVALAAKLGSAKQAAKQLNVSAVSICIWKKKYSTGAPTDDESRMEKAERETAHLMSDIAKRMDRNYAIKQAVALLLQELT